MAEPNSGAPKVWNPPSTTLKEDDRARRRREMTQAVATGIVTRQAMRTPSSLAKEAVRYADAILDELEATKS